jgi:hypothetical protein
MRDTAIPYPRSASRPYLVYLAILVTAALLLVFGPGALFATESEESSEAYIVKGTSSERMAELVVEVGGKVTHELKIIRAVGARLTDDQRNTLAEHPDVSRIWRDREAKVQSAG